MIILVPRLNYSFKLSLLTKSWQVDAFSVAPDSKKKDGEEKVGLKEKMQQMQEITLMVQNILGMVAHIMESIGNVFNFSVPFLSWLAFIVIIVVTMILYNVSLR